MIGQILGLATRGRADATTESSAERQAENREAAAAPVPARESRALSRLQIVHLGAARERRPVRVQAWQISLDEPLETDLFFYSAADLEGDPLPARIVIEGRKGPAKLNLHTPRQAPPGLWCAAICDEHGAQLGFVEILL